MSAVDTAATAPKSEESTGFMEAIDLLLRLGMIADSEQVQVQPLAGGVSSSIWCIRTADRVFVLKRALEQLKVEAEWHAPVDRGASEAAWLEYVAGMLPGTAPQVLAYDPETHAMALEFLDPERYPNWKTLLMDGQVDVAFAASLGDVLGRIHAASAGTPGLADRFANQELFESLRIEPYLLRTAAAVPEAAKALEEIAAGLRATQLALVHGDVSPKNILAGEHPVILDAECATWGDPAFDAAFVLTHLALKAIHMPANREELRAAARSFEAGYIAHIDWEDPSATRSRIRRILPALLLARVAGASPAEYLTTPEKALVHRVAVRALVSGQEFEAVLDEEGEIHG